MDIQQAIVRGICAVAQAARSIGCAEAQIARNQSAATRLVPRNLRNIRKCGSESGSVGRTPVCAVGARERIAEIGAAYCNVVHAGGSSVDRNSPGRLRVNTLVGV